MWTKRGPRQGNQSPAGFVNWVRLQEKRPDSEAVDGYRFAAELMLDTRVSPVHSGVRRELLRVGRNVS